jgi:UPF0755 protein
MKKYFIALGTLLLIAFSVAGIFVIQYSRAPSDFPRNIIVDIPTGSTVSQAAKILEDHGVIRSALAYKIYSVLIHDGSGIKAGEYLFDVPQSVVRIVYRTAFGIENLNKIKVTIPEGATSKDISEIVAKAIPEIDQKKLLTLAKAHEGTLFPDTYFFYQNTSPEQVVDAMQSNFYDQMQKISTTTQSFMASTSVSMQDILKMASIVEKEANSDSDRRIIAGILWKRLADSYPLQVDPPFFYYLNKTSSQLTLNDLATDSPYNLYKNKGLPPTAIDNPGLDAILATVNPIQTKYWYYLSDSQGNMHYATTYDGHLANKDKYIN